MKNLPQLNDPIRQRMNLPQTGNPKRKKERICFICWKNSHLTRDCPYSRKEKRDAQLLADAVEHTSICTIKEDIVVDEGPLETSDLKEKEVNVISGIETPHIQEQLYQCSTLLSFQRSNGFHIFNTTPNGIFTTRVTTKNPITIEFFPSVQFRTKLLGSIIPWMDLIIGFDIYKQLNDRLKCQLVEESCDDSHREFMKKHDKTLWLNEEFFIRLPPKRNENINPTRAIHSGMNPERI
ncbi:hypothetical protein KY285_026442 [Solanum tuberosum]|nr:hypothetical protein KY285_026442 [Solanum tuberosum]